MRAARVVGVNERGFRIGEDHGRAKLSDSDVESMVFLRASGVAYGRLAEIFECSKSHAFRIVNCQLRAQRATEWRRLDTVW